MAVVVDTDLVIDFLRDFEPGVALMRRLAGASRLLVTSVTAYEICLGERVRPDDLAEQLHYRTLPLDLDAALIAGQIGRDLRREGAGIAMADTMIAGICLRHGIPLATRNRKHFQRVPGLELADL